MITHLYEDIDLFSLTSTFKYLDYEHSNNIHKRDFVELMQSNLSTVNSDFIFEDDLKDKAIRDIKRLK